LRSIQPFVPEVERGISVECSCAAFCPDFRAAASLFTQFCGKGVVFDPDLHDLVAIGHASTGEPVDDQAVIIVVAITLP
jgi:hypothetical protein